MELKGKIALIHKAKVELSTTELTVSEIAYALGFEHPASFHKLFKNKTNISPLTFRKSFNYALFLRGYVLFFLKTQAIRRLIL